MPNSSYWPYCLLTCMALLLNACAAGDRPDDRIVRPAQTVQPVQVGGSAIEDACGGSGIVREDQDDVAVRSAPAPKAEQLDKIPGGTVVWFCDQAPGWIGVVYDLDEREDCGTATPAARKTPYAGPCKAGWIERAAVTLLAG